MTLQRRAQIAALVELEGVMRVIELSKRFGVSEVTIRHDLAELEREGRLTRDRGGAIAKSPIQHVSSLLGVDQRSAIHLEEKRRIAQAAAKFLVPGDSIVLDAGTTVVEMAGFLAEVTPLTIVTNALNVALQLSAASARIILLGGDLNRESSSTVGPLAEQALAGLCVEKLFLGAQAIDLEHGLTDSTSEIAQVKRGMIRAAREVILLADSSKWSRTALHKIASLSEIDVVITDNGLSAEARAILQQTEIELVLV